jgi:hypothetical protein
MTYRTKAAGMRVKKLTGQNAKEKKERTRLNEWKSENGHKE